MLGALLFLTGCTETTVPSLPPAPDWAQLRSGDTFYQLGQRYQRPIACLTRYNPQHQPQTLSVGERILLPTPEECASLTAGQQRYQVRRGDTLGGIALHFQLSLQKLKASNPALGDQSSLEVGQWLMLSNLQTGRQTQSSSTISSQRARTTSANSTHLDHSSGTPRWIALPAALQQRPWPLNEARVIREYGPDSRGRIQPMMLAARQSATAMAIADGRVQFANTMRQLGQVVIVHHAHNVQTVYAHCGALNVRVGARVTTGTPLCQVAQDDASASPLLLFDVRQSGHPIDPRRLLK